MTIAELIELLQKLPGDMPVLCMLQNWENCEWVEPDSDMQIAATSWNGTDYKLHIGYPFRELSGRTIAEWLSVKKENHD